MEAIATYDFRATAEDELSFKKGQVLHILQTDNDQNWYNAELDGVTGFVPKNYIEMKPCSWYAGKITRAKAEHRLRQLCDGAFLIRDSETNKEIGSYSLSVKFEQSILHFKVLRDAKYLYFLWVQRFHSLNELVNYHRTASVSRSQKIFLVDTRKPRLARANFDFNAVEAGELPFKRGDVLEILETEDAQWWKGVINGCVGYFPASFVSVNEAVK